MIEEFKIEPTDPELPQTGDGSKLRLWAGLMTVSLCAMTTLLLTRKHREKEKQ